MVAKQENEHSGIKESTFGSEIVAMRSAVDLIESLRCNMRMFGIPIEGPTDVFCDNEAVTKKCGTPESTLKKKHHTQLRITETKKQY
jgi:hypothetical protein